MIVRSVVRYTIAVGVVFLCGASATGCGSSSTGPLAAADAAHLHRDVSAIRSAVQRDDPQEARAAVTALKSDISQLKAARKLAPTSAGVMESDATQLARRIATEVRAPSESRSGPARSEAPAPQSPAPPAGGPGGPPSGGNGGHGGNGGDGGDGGDGGGGGDGGD
jgi:hypothetical protein